MDVRSDIFPDTPDGFHPRDVSVRLARPDERIRWDRLMNQYHYLGFKRFPGRGLPYVFEWRGQWVGLAGWQSGAFKCRPRDQWIGWKRELQFTRMHLIANNTRFLILGAPGCFPNLASFALAAMVQRLSADWSAAQGNRLNKPLTRLYFLNRGVRAHLFFRRFRMSCTIAVGNWLTPVPPHRSPHAR